MTATATPPPDPPFIDLADLARRWETSISSIRRAIRAGRLPAAKPLGKTLVPAEAVAEAERPQLRTMEQPTSATLDVSAANFV